MSPASEFTTGFLRNEQSRLLNCYLDLFGWGQAPKPPVLAALGVELLVVQLL